MLFRAGEQLGQYVLIRELGRGAFGSVWLAQEQNFLEREVALKLPLDDDPDLDVIKQEAKIWLRAGNHTNLVPVLNAGVFEGQVAIASEYVGGGTLTQWLRKHGRQAPSTEAALTMIAGILSGLEHLHTLRPHPLIHRDLKPANVLLDEETQTPRITDFGISRVLKTTASTNISGTPVYMAPEMFEGRYSAKSDIWAVGVMLYQMLTGRLPFQGANMMQLGRMIERDEPEQLPDTIPLSIRDVIAVSMKKDPAQRHGSASEMRNALMEAVHPVPSPHRVVLTPSRVDNFFAGLNQVEVLLEKETVPSSETNKWDLPPMVSGQLPGTKINPVDGAEMILIPAGEFIMGDEDMSDEDIDEDDLSDNPRRTVTLTDYYIYKYPVTVGQYRKFCRAERRAMPAPPEWGWKNDHPIANVSWEEAQAYCEWADVSLPTEAQWEKAARGTDGREFPWGNEWDRSKCQCSNEVVGLTKSTAPVGSYPQGASSYGVLDMAGNVWEWCEDWFDDEQILRVLRGGSFSDDNPTFFRTSNRDSNVPENFGNDTGFRCASGANSH